MWWFIMWSTAWMVPLSEIAGLFLSLLAVVKGGQSCTFFRSGSNIATYCETNCCDNACCNQTGSDSSTASIVLGVVAAVILIIIIVIVIVIVVCCCKNGGRCRRREKDSIVPISDKVVSLHDETEETETRKPRSVRWMDREGTFSIFP